MSGSMRYGRNSSQRSLQSELSSRLSKISFTFGPFRYKCESLYPFHLEKREMQKFTAMIEFPFDMFYPLMREFDETVIVNQSSLVGNVQTADITFDIEALPKVLSLFPTMDVTMHGLTPITETAKMIKTIAKKKSYV